VGGGMGKVVGIGCGGIVFPRVGVALMQAAVASCDMLLQAAVAYTLLPPGHGMTYWRFANAFLLAIAAAIVSHVPGGAGVLEVVILEFVPHDDPTAIFGSLLMFRAIFYFLALMVAVTLFLGHEWFAHRRRAEAAK